MLPPFIIQQIRKREQEQERARQRQQPRVEIPLDRRPVKQHANDDDEDDANRGVVVVDVLN